MNRQMTAERERRAIVTRADGEREASIAVAEGEKQAAILRSEGVKQSAVLEAEGERQAQLLRAQGFAMALQAIYSQAKDVDEKTMALQYLDALRQIGSSASTKFILPMELTSMMQQFAATMTGSGSSPRSNGTDKIE
jgi:regulator of protease activity HflC (stomatin/prohibitin superfamily)